ncbi:MAG: DnaD domain protein [Anaerolineales bacterium]
MTFEGFPSGKINFTKIPSLFFRDLLPAIDNLEELKVTLYALWQVTRMEGETRYLRVDDFTSDPTFMKGMGETAEEAHQAVEKGLTRAVERGTMMRIDLDQEGKKVPVYFFNSPKGRAAVKAAEDESWRPPAREGTSTTLDIEQPNIYQLYEENIGPITPLVADLLRDAEEQYPENWIRQAFEIAVENNVRKWKYIEAILRSWQEEGRDDRRDQRYSEKSRREYLEDEFADFIED